MGKYTLEYIREKGLILYEVLSGSHAYGTNHANSDLDYKGIYIAEMDDVLSGNYPEQISDEKNDVTFYEIGRYLDLLNKNNPNILEMLCTPSDCIIQRSDLLNYIKPEEFVSKLCSATILGYAVEQIKKARGLNKKIFNQMDKEKKTPMDFCYVIIGNRSFHLSDYLFCNNMEQKFVGATNIDNAGQTHALFYDWKSHNCFSESIPLWRRKIHKRILKLFKIPFGYGYKGLMIEGSNDIRLSSIPHGQNPVATFHYNKDGYSIYSKRYAEYWDWVEKRNQERYDMASGKSYDPKNMMHCFRLVQTACEIARGEGVNIRRKNVDFLMQIRRGEIEYNDILSKCENMMDDAVELFKTSNLIDHPKIGLTQELLIKIRREFYGI